MSEKLYYLKGQDSTNCGHLESLQILGIRSKTLPCPPPHTHIHFNHMTPLLLVLIIQFLVLLSHLTFLPIYQPEFLYRHPRHTHGQPCIRRNKSSFIPPVQTIYITQNGTGIVHNPLFKGSPEPTSPLKKFHSGCAVPSYTFNSRLDIKRRCH